MQNNLRKELTAMALVVTTNQPKQVLLVHSRKHNLWMPPGGHVESDENPVEAAIRETDEETGLDVSYYLNPQTIFDENRKVLPLPMRIVEVRLTHSGEEHYHVDCMYKVELPEPVEVRHDETESSDIGWFTLSELKELKIPVDILPVLKDIL